MATTEFQQTGSTSGQRIAATNATEPAGKPGRPPSEAIDLVGDMSSSDQFVADFLATNPRPDKPAAPDIYEGYSNADLAPLLRRLNNDQASHSMDSTLAEQVSPLMQEL